MKALIIFFSQTGRTKRMAEAIASTLSHYEVTLSHVESIVSGSVSGWIKIPDKDGEGGYSLLEKDNNPLDAGGYDLVIIGMPTIGGKPPEIFHDIIAGIKNLKGKDVIVFGTSRIYPGHMLLDMKTGAEARGGRVINQINFKGLFGLGKRRAVDYGKMIDNLKTGSN